MPNDRNGLVLSLSKDECAPPTPLTICYPALPNLR
jgi:hypothetical protein